jgi:glutamyl-tRNA reductase
MIVVVGLSHKSAPVEVRERFATSADVLPAVLARLASRAELKEVMFLSTCNRVEVFASASSPDRLDAAVRAVRAVMCDHAGVGDAEAVTPYFYERTGQDATRHIFRVAASLDSMVLGEPQILGQVKEAFDAATAAGTLGNYLGRCIHRAFTVAKRVRTETQIGAGSVSISSVAVDLARGIFGDLTNHTVLLLGAGEMAEAAAKSLGKGARHIRVCNRSFERGATLAGAIGGDAVQWDALGDELVRADVVVASTSSQNYVVTRDLVKRAMKQRKGKTLFFIDIAVPRNVEPSVHGIDNVYVYNVDDLEQQVAEAMKSRKAEAEQAEKIVSHELSEFEAWAKGQSVAPTIVKLRAKTRAVLMAELERTLGGKLRHLTEGDRAALAQMMESATNKLLHAPTTRLRESGAGADGLDAVQAVKKLFDLPEDAPTASEGEEPSGEGASPAGDGPRGEGLPH